MFQLILIQQILSTQNLNLERIDNNMPIAYLYDVVDNQIKLNKIATKKAIKSCKIVYEDDLLQEAFDPREFSNSLLYKWAK